MAKRSRRLSTVALAVVFALVGGLSGGAAGAAEPTIERGLLRVDGTNIAWNLFVPAGAGPENPVPVILMTHGWGGSGSKNYSGRVKFLVDRGYAVLTWDQRGFGTSGGEANVDSQEYEVRDVRALITFVAGHPAIQTDGSGDPRMGMLGGSYAGGIQLMTASADPRVDAIAPDIAWNDLPQTLKPGGVFKLQWDLLLYGFGLATAIGDGVAAGETGAYAPQIHQSFVEANALNDWSTSTGEWFASKSPTRYINGAVLADGTVLPGIHAPALITQGTIDTLFPINQAIANFDQIAANGVPVKTIFFCGGHTANEGRSCAVGNRNGVIDEAILAWFDRHVRGNAAADTGAPIVYQTQDGDFHSVAALPATRVSTGEGSGRIVSTVAPTSGGVLAATPSPAGIRFGLSVPAGAHLLGIPRAKVSVTGTGAEAYLFFKLLDLDAAGNAVVVDDQVMAKKVTWLSATPQGFVIDLAGVAWKVAAGHSIAVEVASTSADHASSRLPYVVDFTIDASVPYLMPA